MLCGSPPSIGWEVRGRWGEGRWCLLSVEVLCSELSPPVKLSDSGRWGSQAGRGPANAAKQPASLHARDSASDMADLGAAGTTRYLRCLQGTLERLLTNQPRSYDAAGSKAQQCASPNFVQCRWLLLFLDFSSTVLPRPSWVVESDQDWIFWAYANTEIRQKNNLIPWSFYLWSILDLSAQHPPSGHARLIYCEVCCCKIHNAINKCAVLTIYFCFDAVLSENPKQNRQQVVSEW